VKLIVPHNIKYIHHTHVLLVKPTKKKPKHYRDDYAEDHEHHQDYHDTPRARSKPLVHYVVPYNVAEAKKYGSPERDENEPRIVPVPVPVKKYGPTRAPFEVKY